MKATKLLVTTLLITSVLLLSGFLKPEETIGMTEFALWAIWILVTFTILPLFCYCSLHILIKMKGGMDALTEKQRAENESVFTECLNSFYFYAFMLSISTLVTFIPRASALAASGELSSIYGYCILIAIAFVSSHVTFKKNNKSDTTDKNLGYNN